MKVHFLVILHHIEISSLLIPTLLFSGFNSTMREGNITYYEYMQVGKGLDMGMNQISRFEANVACSNGEQTLSRDIYRLGHGFDFCRMLSLYFTTVGFYFSSLVRLLEYIYPFEILLK